MTEWTAIIPVKPWRIAKSRLALPAGLREALSRAFFLDVLEAVRPAIGIEAIVIISAEPEVAEVAGRYRAVLHTGHKEVTAVDPGMRRDVDYLSDLAEAARSAWAATRPAHLSGPTPIGHCGSTH